MLANIYKGIDIKKIFQGCAQLQISELNNYIKS
jgi:hypothetical protein